MIHLTNGEIESFVDGSLADEPAQRVGEHTLRCSECRDQLGKTVFRRIEDPEAAYDGPIARAIAAAMAQASRFRQERKALEQYLAEIAGHPEAMLDISWRRAASLRGLPLVEALLAASFAARYRDPHLMWSLALLGKSAAETLEPARYPRALIADHQAHAWAELANAERVSDALSAAERALAIAKRKLLDGSGDALVVARVVDIEASLRFDQRRLPEALRLLEKVCRTYGELGERHLRGRALVAMGYYTYYTGDPAKAATLTAEALCLLDRQRDPKLVAAALKNHLLFLSDSGQCLQASELLLRSGLREAFQDDPLTLLRLRWVEGKIYTGLGRFDRAAQAFEEVHAGFVERDLHYDGALVGLDLAAALLELGRTARVRQIATEKYETFKRLGIHGEALRALEFLHKAALRDQVTLPKVQTVRRFLTLAEWQPQLKFAAG